MISVTQTLQRQNWLLNLLIKRKKVSLAEINKEWLRSSLAENDREPLGRKQWYRYFNDLGDIYGIIVGLYDEKMGPESAWCIKNPEVFYEENIFRWMMGCLRHRTMLEACMNLNDRVDIDTFPSENGWLPHFVMAIRKKRMVEINYKRYGEEKSKVHQVAPLYIKTYKKRLYVLCQSRTGHFCICFDRIIDLKLLPTHYKMDSDMPAKEFFENCYGVMLPPEGMKVEKIIVRARGTAMYYLRDVPLHHSQQEIGSGKDYVDFALTVYPTLDLIGDIIQQGDRLEVRSPAHVREMVKEHLTNALNRY